MMYWEAWKAILLLITHKKQDQKVAQYASHLLEAVQLLFGTAARMRRVITSPTYCHMTIVLHAGKVRDACHS